MIHNFIFSNKIILWYLNTNTQYFPWQLHKTAYNVWLSEIMLQQTQVITVIPYYEKFIKKFPTILKLAASELNEVLYLWSGLGYYKRAINLHKTAKIISEYHAGQFPKDFNILTALPGIGRSTAGAILSLAFDQCYPILDSNVKRILIRYHFLNIDIMKKSIVYNKLWSLIEQLIPNKNISIFNQAIMNLGRLICTHKNPKCNICPINNCCYSFLAKTDTQYISIKNNITKKSKRMIWWLLLLLKKDKMVWLVQRSQESVWTELFCFPEFHELHMLKQWLLKHNLYNVPRHNMKILRHQINNIQLEIQPIYINLNKIIHIIENNGMWYNFNKSIVIGLPTPVSIMLNKLKLYFQ